MTVAAVGQPHTLQKHDERTLWKEEEAAAGTSRVGAKGLFRWLKKLLLQLLHSNFFYVICLQCW